jgi:hypothetical protein
MLYSWPVLSATCWIDFSDSLLVVELESTALNVEETYTQFKSYNYLLTASYLQAIMLARI